MRAYLHGRSAAHNGCDRCVRNIFIAALLRITAMINARAYLHGRSAAHNGHDQCARITTMNDPRKTWIALLWTLMRKQLIVHDFLSVT